MKTYLISDDNYLKIAFSNLIDNLEILNGGDVLSYYKNKNKNRLLILIDERIPDIKFYFVKPQERKSDSLILLRGRNHNAHEMNLIFDRELNLKNKKDYILDFIKKSKSDHVLNVKDKYFNNNYITKKELVILELLINGAKIHEISETTNLSVQSVYRHRESIVNKYGFCKFCFFSSEMISTQSPRDKIIHDYKLSYI